MNPQNPETDETTLHLIRCYGNVQEVIKFLDTKAAVIFTLSGAMLGVLTGNQPSHGRLLDK